MRRTGVKQIIFILGLTIVSSIGCEKDCVQGAIKDCLCLSGGESTATCDGNSGEWKACDCYCDPEVKKFRLCACPPVEGKVFQQECKSSYNSENYYMWHPCQCPSKDDDDDNENLPEIDTTPKDSETGDGDTGDSETEDGDTDKEIDGGSSDSGV